MRAIAGEAIFEVADLLAEGHGKIPIRCYRPCDTDTPLPVIVFFHGGGFVAGSVDTHDALCRALCRESGANVVSVEYRLAPEHAYPAALDDCVSAIRWLAKGSDELKLDCDRLALCGDSAGGYLAVATAIAMRLRPGSPNIRHVGLLYPVVDPACDTASMQTLGDGYILSRDAMKWFWQAFRGKGNDRQDLSLLSKDLSGIGAVLIITAEFDPLRDEGAQLAQAFSAAGVEATVCCYDGMIHGFASLLPITPFARKAVQQLAVEINRGFAG